MSRSSALAVTVERRPDLQGMRAVAVLAVLTDHLFGWPSGGFVGVDVFLVLSGFFITGLLIRERAATGQLSFTNFYVRRVKRILPSALLVLFVTVVGSYVLLPAARARDTLVDALWAAVFGANVRFEAVGADYFQQDQPPSPLQHFWSLSVEEQFYFVWPAVIVAIFALTRQARRGDREWVRQAGLFGATAIVVLASFAWAMWLSGNDANTAYFSTFTRVWELGVGALVAIAAPWLNRLPESIRPALAYLGLAGVACSLFVINSTVRFPAPWALLPVLSTALVVASFSGVPVRGVAALTNPVARYFGDTSYTLYLWHWPVIMLLLAVMAKGPVFYAVALALSLGLTALTYRHYENPIRQSDWLLDKPVKTESRFPSPNRLQWGFGGAAAALMVVLSIMAIGYNDKMEAAQELAAQAKSTDSGRRSAGAPSGPSASGAAPAAIDPCFGAPAMVTTGCALWNPANPVEPGIDRLRSDTQGAYECNRKEGEPVTSCTYGYTGDDAAARIAIVGDSHASAILPAIWPFLEQNKWELTTFAGWACRFDQSSDCLTDEVRAKILAQRYDVLLLTGSRKYGGDFGALQSGLAPIAAAGTQIVFISDAPVVSGESMACLTRANNGVGKLGDCGTPSAEGLGVPDPMTTAAGLIQGSTLIDLTRYYCKDDRCPSVIGDVVPYLDDGGHVTATFAESLSPAIFEGLRPVLAPKSAPGTAAKPGELGTSPTPSGANPPASSSVAVRTPGQ